VRGVWEKTGGHGIIIDGSVMNLSGKCHQNCFLVLRTPKLIQYARMIPGLFYVLSIRPLFPRKGSLNGNLPVTTKTKAKLAPRLCA
jgi:hypothetical protein